MKHFSLLLFYLFLTPGVAADDKIFVDNEYLIYDTITTDTEIVSTDYYLIETLLKENPQITTVILNSLGGVIEDAYYISDLMIDYEINTHVIGECSSACTLLLLAGEKRTVEKGSWVGYHQGWWAANDIETYYNIVKEDMDWNTPFDLAEWLYEDTQREILEDMEYLIERGVEPLFAIKTLSADSTDMWYPRRKELREAGIITE